MPKLTLFLTATDDVVSGSLYTAEIQQEKSSVTNASTIEDECKARPSTPSKLSVTLIGTPTELTVIKLSEEIRATSAFIFHIDASLITSSELQNKFCTNLLTRLHHVYRPLARTMTESGFQRPMVQFEIVRSTVSEEKSSATEADNNTFDFLMLRKRLTQLAKQCRFFSTCQFALTQAEDQMTQRFLLVQDYVSYFAKHLQVATRPQDATAEKLYALLASYQKQKWGATSFHANSKQRDLGLIKMNFLTYLLNTYETELDQIQPSKAALANAYHQAHNTHPKYSREQIAPVITLGLKHCLANIDPSKNPNPKVSF